MNPYKTDKINLVDFMEKIRLEDYRYANSSSRIHIGYWFFIAFYIVLIGKHIYDGNSLIEIFSSVCYLFSMVTFAFIFRYYSKEFKDVDYSLATLTVLKNVADRYNPFRSKMSLVFIAVLLVDLGLSVKETTIAEILWIQVMFAIIITIAIVVGLVIWYKRYKPLRDEALLLIRQIEEE